jgi:hypothetical protein
VLLIVFLQVIQNHNNGNRHKENVRLFFQEKREREERDQLDAMEVAKAIAVAGKVSWF